MATPAGDRPTPDSARAGILTGGLLILVSGFLPWFTPVDSSYRSAASCWSLGPAAAAVFVLGLGLMFAVVLPLVVRWFPSSRPSSARLVALRAARSRVVWPGVVRRLRPPRLTVGVSVAVAGAAVLAVLAGWLMAPSFTDPALPGPGRVAEAGVLLPWPGSGPAMPAVPGAGLYLALVGTSIELAACAWASRRSGFGAALRPGG
ncbi:hypothetical protein CcI49_15790 [Frankia sp. CcI49]|uniref:hypothetical protein n=1 Tax=unclassified Frankia TaxID=2632575 RepID=UPI0006CA1990|nr:MULTISPECIES: hypothetical protein [unclassified Frankia]KPM51318.1 hypothetical protein ACG83_34845 [Frankia sp. R43]ONH59446.1 hypothetical protein CcI49_15790 [Frankia sp. CcI49]